MNILQTQLTKVYINSEDKNGKKFLTKNGKPYKKIAIQTAEYGKEYLSSFIWNENDPRFNWQAGDVVEMIIEKNGQYTNFRLPTEIDIINIRLDKIEKHLFRIKKDNEANNDFGPEEPKDEITAEELPF